jgi:prepilin-type N-terminal cleavage/methylation domain-containing protein/prepilin-type processing-associated H-X9-DG protein
MPVPPSRRGLTLLELVVVIAIVGILTGLLLSAVQRARDAAARAQCSNNLRQIGLALHSYHDSQQSFPPGVSYGNGTDPYPFMSWCTRLLPYLELQPSWERAQRAYAQEKSFLLPAHDEVRSQVVSAFLCPSDGRVHQSQPVAVGNASVAFTSYLGVEGIDQSSRDGLLFLDSHVRLANVTDGTSNTLMVGERPPSADLVLGWWYAGWGQSKDGSGDMVLGVRERNVSTYGWGCAPGPYQYGSGRTSNQCDAFHYWSLHFGGSNFLFADGSARLLSYAANPVMPALATRAGGEAAAIPD